MLSRQGQTRAGRTQIPVFPPLSSAELRQLGFCVKRLTPPSCRETRAHLPSSLFLSLSRVYPFLPWAATGLQTSPNTSESPLTIPSSELPRLRAQSKSSTHEPGMILDAYAVYLSIQLADPQTSRDEPSISHLVPLKFVGAAFRGAGGHGWVIPPTKLPTISRSGSGSVVLPAKRPRD